MSGAISSSLRFVDEIARLAERTRQTVPADEVRRKLAVEMVYRFIPGTSILGVRVRRLIAGRKPVVDQVDHPPAEWGADGFRPSLTAGGQGEEVVRHVAAAAACVLARRVYLVWIASFYDWMQGLFRGRAEAKAEIAGNKAGIRVGRVLVDYAAGRIDASRLRARLATILCE